MGGEIMSALYSVKNWSAIYENSESRKRDSLKWIATPNEHQGNGWGRMVAHKKKVELFCAWNLIIQVASKCPCRGVLAARDSVPYNAEDLAFKTGFPVSIFELAFKFFSGNDVRWLERKDDAELSRTMPNDAEPYRENGTELNGIGLDGIEQEGIEAQTQEACAAWRTDFKVYETECVGAFEEAVADTDWMEQRSKYHPSLDIRLSLEKAMNDFWATEAGWKHKKQSRAREISWRRTIENALTLTSNQVRKPYVKAAFSGK